LFPHKHSKLIPLICKNGQYLIKIIVIVLEKITSSILSTTYLLKMLFQLPNHLFEELAMDVYDEVDRRETESSKY
jgi:hypothetical protein